MADAGEGWAMGVVRECQMTEAEIRTTTVRETDAGAQATNDERDPAQFRKIVQIDQSDAVDRSGMPSGCSVSALITKRNRRY